MENYGTLYVVALPIGNHLDISLRAKQILEEVDVVAAEDTRTLIQKNHLLCLNLKQLVSHHEHNEESSSKGLIQILKEGKSVALVSDAGTPGISDPGYRVVRDCFENNILVKAIPGASALTAFLSVCPIGGSSHYFAGFPPSKAGERKRLFQDLKRLHGVCSKLVFYESPHRILEHLENALEVFGNRHCFLLREITKTFEESYFMDIQSAILLFQEKAPKGEFVLAYDFEPDFTDQSLTNSELEAEILDELNQGTSSKDIQNKLESRVSISRKELYQKIQKLKSR